MCAIRGAQKLGNSTEVDIKYDPVTWKNSEPFIKPKNPDKFVCDPRDYRRMDLGRTQSGGTWNGRFANGNYCRNVGRFNARYESYPRFSIDYVNDIHQLVKSGFYWYKDPELKNPRGILHCVHCWLKIEDWKPGMNADVEHRKRNPDCEYIFHRNAGCEMDVYTYWNGENGFVKPWRCLEPHDGPQETTPPAPAADNATPQTTDQTNDTVWCSDASDSENIVFASNESSKNDDDVLLVDLVCSDSASDSDE